MGVRNANNNNNNMSSPHQAKSSIAAKRDRAGTAGAVMDSGLGTRALEQTGTDVGTPGLLPADSLVFNTDITYCHQAEQPSTWCIVTLLLLGDDNTSSQPKQRRRTRQCAPQRHPRLGLVVARTVPSTLRARCLAWAVGRRGITSRLRHMELMFRHKAVEREIAAAGGCVVYEATRARLCC